jgi:hypothetical protein
MTRDEYLQHAEECEQLATMAKLPSNRMALVESAQMWRKLADNLQPKTAQAQARIMTTPGT